MYKGNNNMKILSTSLAIAKNNNKIKNIKNTLATNPVVQNNNVIPNNTLSEALGRSMVNFTGTGVNKPSSFEYENTTMFNPFGEEIKYNKETGEFVYSEYYSDGSLRKKVEVSPVYKQETVTECDDNGMTITQKGVNGYSIKKYDSKNRMTFSEDGDNEGYKVKINYDYDLNRSIRRDFYDEYCDTIEIRDLTTDERIYEGPQAEETVSENTNLGHNEITRNIITGSVYQVKEFRGKKLISDVIYSRKTGKVVIDKKYNSSKGSIVEKNYTEDGALVSIIKHHEGKKEIKSYNQNGVLDGHLLYEYNSRGRVERKVEYSLNYDDVYLTETHFENKGNYTKTFFEESPQNRMLRTQTYQDGELTEEIFYNKNGDIHHIREYTQEGFFRDDYLDKEGNIVASEYNDKGGTYKCEMFFKGTDIVKRKIEVINQKGDYEDITYDRESGYPVEKIIRGADDRILEVYKFYPKSNRPETVRYYKAKTYVESKFAPSGECYSTREYNLDGSVHFDTFDVETPFEKDSEQELLEILEKISKATAKRSFEDLTKEELVIFLDYAGLDSIEELVYMDKATFRKLAKKFHPDANIGKGVNMRAAEITFTIINTFWQRAQEKSQKAN